MNNLLKLFTLSVTLPIRIISLIMINFDLIERANTVGINALNVELDQVQSALDARSAALADSNTALAEARKARATAAATKRTADIKADFE